VLYDYVCTYWPTHLRLSRLPDENKTSELLRWFLMPEQYSGQYKSWQQIYHHDIQHYCSCRPPLHYAIDFGVDFVTEKLLLGGQDVDNLYNGMAALHRAAKCGDFDTCVALLKQGASLDLKSGSIHKSMTALHLAAEGGHLAVIKLLIANGASLHARTSSETTPLYRAVRSGSLEAVKVLYAAGSDIDARTWDNWTPLFEALADGFGEIANQLLAWGTDPTIVTHGGHSALTLILEAKNIIYIDRGLRSKVMLGANAKSNLYLTTQDVRELKPRARAQARVQPSTEITDDVSYEYLGNAASWRYRLERIETDSRPGIERDKSCLRIEGHVSELTPIVHAKATA
jgi:ankyrin repeat protein